MGRREETRRLEYSEGRPRFKVQSSGLGVPGEGDGRMIGAVGAGFLRCGAVTGVCGRGQETALCIG